MTEIILLKNIDNNNIIKYYGYTIDNDGNFYILTGIIFINARINGKRYIV
jgi:hypothetical protein